MREGGHGDVYVQTCMQIGYTRLDLCADGCAWTWGWVGVDGPVHADWHTHRWVGGMGVCMRVAIVSNLDTVGCEMNLHYADGPVWMGLRACG